MFNIVVGGMIHKLVIWFYVFLCIFMYLGYDIFFSAVILRMSAAEDKPIEVIKFDEFNNDGRVDGNFYSDGEYTSNGENNVYLGVPVEYKNDDYKPSRILEDNAGSKSITFTSLKKVKYEFLLDILVTS